ncbi:MAG: redoxin family protein [Deltaproteobacteria bacterium]|nr:redoxin family protein [Deltaproteobacteria bacterium]
MPTVKFRGSDLKLAGSLPIVGANAPALELVAPDLSAVTLEDFHDRRVVIATVHSVDAPEGAQAVRNLHRALDAKEDVALVVVSADSPYALKRFQAFESLDGPALLSCLGWDFGTRWGVQIADAPLRGHLARAWFVVDSEGAIRLASVLPDLLQEEPLDPLLAALA